MAIIGLDKLRSELLKIGQSVHDEVLPEAIGAAAEVIKVEMESAAKRGEPYPGIVTGELAGSIERQKVQSKELTGAQVIGERVGPNKDAYYALFLEYGHVAMGRSGRLQRSASKTTHSQSGTIPPSMEKKGKRPFIRPTADASSDKAVQAATDAAAVKLRSMGITS